MDEDKLLDRIRALTYNDDPPFPLLMDMIVELALELKIEYLYQTKLRKKR